ncbi:RNA-directed DNA polymerase, eukaryota [Tanacetum coccineum]
MCSTHTDNQTCMATTNTVHSIPLAALHLNQSLLVLHLNPTLAVLHLSGAGNANYLQRALTDYHVEYKVPFTLLHCWKVLKECDGWSSEEVPMESGEGSINLYITVGDEEDEVEEVRRPRPMGRVQAKRKAKAGSAASSTSAFDVESLAKIMANEYLMDSDPYHVQKNQEMSEL